MRARSFIIGLQEVYWKYTVLLLFFLDAS